MFDEKLKYLDEFPFVVGRIKSCTEFHVIPILKDHISTQYDLSVFLKDADLIKFGSKTQPVEDVTYLSMHSRKRLLTRVMVLKVHAEGYLDVFNIDDLTFESVETSGIRKFPNSMPNFNLPMTVIKLFNIECSKEICEDPIIALNRITELMHHKRLYAVIRQIVGDVSLVDIYEENITNLVYQQLIDEGLFVRTNEALVEQLSIPPTEIEKYDIMEHHDQEFSCIFKYMKETTAHVMIFPLIDEHIDNMREMEAALKNLELQNLPKITEPFLNKTCIVHSPTLRRCYRAKILSVIYQTSCVKILLIDENTTVTVSMTQIRQIPLDLMFYKTKNAEVSLHNFQFKKGFEKEMTRDLIRIMKDKTIDVLIRAFDDKGIPIVDLYKKDVHILIYQSIIDEFTLPPIIEVPKIAAGSAAQTNSSKKPLPVSEQSYDEDFLCTFAYMLDPYNIVVYPIIDTGVFVPEEIRATSSGFVNSAYLEKVTNPDYDTCYYACVPRNTNCYLSKIVHFDSDKKRVKIHLLEFDKFMFVQLEDLFEIPDLQIESIVVTLNFRFDPKFDAFIENELNLILKNERINVVIRESEPDSLLVVDMYKVGSKKLIYQKLIDLIIDKEKEEMKPKNSNISISTEIEELKQNLNSEEYNLITFDDISADQTFEKQEVKRLYFNEEDVILKSLGVGVFSCLLVDFKSFNNIQVLPLINTYLNDIEPLEVQVTKFQMQKLSVKLYKVRINKDLDLQDFENMFCLFIGDQTLTAVVRDSDDDGVPIVDLYGRNPFILAYQDFIDDGSFIVDDKNAEQYDCLSITMNQDQLLN